MAKYNKVPTPDDFLDEGIILDGASEEKRMGREYRMDDVYIPSESDRFARERDYHYRPEVVQSGNLDPAQGENPVRATAGNRIPARFTK